MNDHDFGARLDELSADPPPSTRSVVEAVDRSRRRLLRRRRRRAGVGVLAAAAVAVSGAVLVPSIGSDDGSAAPAERRSGEATESLDLGELTETEADAVRDGAGVPAGEYIVKRRYDAPYGSVPVVIVGDAVASDYAIGSTEGPAPTDERPVTTVRSPFASPIDRDAFRHIGNIPRDLLVAGYSVPKDYWATSGLLRVADGIDRVEVRVGSEPWRTSPNVNGYVFWTTWFEYDDYAPTDRLTLEFRAYDDSGQRLDPSLLPEPRTIAATPPPSTNDQYVEKCELLFTVARQHLDPRGEHLNQGEDNHGDCTRSQSLSAGPDGLTAASPKFVWEVAGDSRIGVVTAGLAVSRAEHHGDDSGYGILLTPIPCLPEDQVDASCERVDIGGGEYVWVRDESDLLSVTYVQPDGEPAYIEAWTGDGNLGEPITERPDVTLDQLIGFVTDERLAIN